MALIKYKLGLLIELVLDTNSELLFTADDVRGMTITKEIIPTKANVLETDLSKFLIVNPNEFIYNPRTHGKKIGFGYNNTCKPFIISWNNIAFRIKPEMKDIISPDYLFLHFKRDEWDREACFCSWGSSTEVFSWDTLCDMEIELPPLPIQQKYVDIYKAMVENQQTYERGLDDLKLVCDAYIEDLRRKMPCEPIGQYIHKISDKNENLQVTNVKGVESSGKFIETRATTEGLDFSNYKIVSNNQIAYNPSRINLGSIALCEEKCIVSPMYEVFEVIDENKMLPKYLMLWLQRNEFLRSTKFYAMGSVRDTFDLNLMKEVCLPIPKLDIQQDIVNIYNAYNERKEINEKLKAQIKEICPILIKGSIEEAKRAVEV